MRAILVTETGGPDVLQPAQLAEPVAGPGQVVVEVAASGLNFIDVYQRIGLYPRDLPFIPGMEGAGVVTATGPATTRFQVGDRVAWAMITGSYAEQIAVTEESAVAVPDEIDLETAAAVMLQGLTAHYLAKTTFPLGPGSRCLIHAGAGGVGLLLTQIAKRLGAEVFTTVGTADKAQLSRQAGADHVIDYSDTDFVAAVEAIGGHRPIDVVYDGVGASVFDRSLGLLRPRGMMVSFGNASGPVPPVSPLTLSSNGSLFLTRPTLGHYIADRAELEWRAEELFQWIIDGLAVRVSQRLPLAEAATAHRLLETRATTGKVLLIP